MKLKTWLLTGCGFALLGLGAVGLFLPMWPTTPFVLLAIACFSGNPRLRSRLLKNSFIREHYNNYRYRTGLPKSKLLLSLGFLWLGLLCSMLLLGQTPLFWILLCVGLAVSGHLLWMAKPKPKRPEERSAPESEAGP